MNKKAIMYYMTIYNILLFVSCTSTVVSPSVQSGNWQWKNASANSNLANINTPIVLNTAYDVITLRYQMLLGLINTSTQNQGSAKFNVYLQYYNAGSSTSASSNSASGGWLNDATYGIIPVDTQRFSGTNAYSGSYDRFSGGKYTVGETDNSNLNYSQTNGWHTVSDEGVVYSSSSADYSASRSAFTMSSSNTTSTNATLSIGTYGSNNYTKLDISPLYGYPITVSTGMDNGEIIYNKTNGSSSGEMPIPLSVNVNSTKYSLAEFEFHIKVAALMPLTSSNINTNVGVKPGDRIFFRVRVAGQVVAGSTTTTGYASVYGIGGGYYNSSANNTTNKSSATANPGLKIGNYKVNNPFPYLDISPSFYAITLPVVYTQELSASVNNDIVHLIWKTGSEINNNYFIVQRSSDLINWSTIDRIKSHFSSGNGNGYNYSSNDKNPVFGNNYYRLIQYDLDGNENIGSVVSVYFGKNNSNIYKIYPNPAINEIYIDGVKLNNRIIIYDISGKILRSLVVYNIPQVVNINNLVKGIYIVSIENSIDKKIFKIIKN